MVIPIVITATAACRSSVDWWLATNSGVFPFDIGRCTGEGSGHGANPSLLTNYFTPLLVRRHTASQSPVNLYGSHIHTVRGRLYPPRVRVPIQASWLARDFLRLAGHGGRSTQD